MTDQKQICVITLEEALKLVHFYRDFERNWKVGIVEGGCDVVKGNCGRVEGNCGRVEGNCDIVEGNCGIVEGSCDVVNGNCQTVKGNCDVVEGNCVTVGGEVLDSINGRWWYYEETPREKLKRLIEESADKEQLLEAFNQLEDNQ
jgi:hypothetical protein